MLLRSRMKVLRQDQESLRADSMHSVIKKA
jgi:hypothetical protein